MYLQQVVSDLEQQQELDAPDGDEPARLQTHPRRCRSLERTVVGPKAKESRGSTIMMCFTGKQYFVDDNRQEMLAPIQLDSSQKNRASESSTAVLGIREFFGSQVSRSI